MFGGSCTVLRIVDQRADDVRMEYSTWYWGPHEEPAVETDRCGKMLGKTVAERSFLHEKPHSSSNTARTETRASSMNHRGP
jgi:hypothetical protein